MTATWQQFSLDSLFPTEVSEAVSLLGDVSGQVAVAAETAATAVEALAAILVDVADPLDSVVGELVETLRNAVGDTLSTGVYFYWDVEGWPFGPSQGLIGWIARWERSFDDPGDENRPVFSNDAEVGAVLLIGGADSLGDLMELLKALGELLGIQSFIDAWKRFEAGLTSNDALEDLTRGVPLAPDWYSVELGEVVPPLNQVARIVNEAIDALARAGGAADLLRDLAAALREKVEALLALSARLQTLIDQLAAILEIGGLYALPIESAAGVEGIKAAVATAGNKPPFRADAYIAGVCLLAGRAEFERVTELLGL